MIEFKKITSKNEIRYVLESASSGATGASAVASSTVAVDNVQRRSNILAQEGDKISVPVTQKPRQGPLRPQTGGGAHRDKKKEQKQGKEKHRKPFAEDDVSEELKKRNPTRDHLRRYPVPQDQMVRPVKKKEEKKKPEQGVAEADLSRRGFLGTLGKAGLAAAGIGLASKAQARVTPGPDGKVNDKDDRGFGGGRSNNNDLGNGFVLTTIDVAGYTVKAVLDTQTKTHYTLNRRPEGGGAIIRNMAPFIVIKDGQIKMAMNVGPETLEAMKKAGLETTNEDIAEGSEFGAYYSEQVAQEIFNKRQDITSEDEVLNQAYHIVSNDKGQRSARYMFNYDADFPSDVVSNYFYLQKQQGVDETNIGKQTGNAVNQMGNAAAKGEFSPSSSAAQFDPNRAVMQDDHEISMASNELKSITADAMKLLMLIKKYSEMDGLEAWQQSKITKAADYLNAVLQSISGEQTHLEALAKPWSRQDMEAGATRPGMSPRPVTSLSRPATSRTPNPVRSTPLRTPMSTVQSPSSRVAGMMARLNEPTKTDPKTDEIVRQLAQLRDAMVKRNNPGDSPEYVQQQIRLALQGKPFDNMGLGESLNQDIYLNQLEAMLEEKVRLDPKCWKGKKIGNPKTKMKGGVRVNNCVPAESVAEDDEAVRAFLAKGGKIQVGKTHPPRKAEKWQGSAHIGAAGGKGTKGSVSGMGANTRKDSKPVVSVEAAPKGWEGTVKAMKKHKEIDNPWALAHYMKNKGYKSHKKEDAYMESLLGQLEERTKK